MMINKLSSLHLRETIIPNYNTLGKTIPNHNTFWEIIIPNYSGWHRSGPVTLILGEKVFLLLSQYQALVCAIYRGLVLLLVMEWDLRIFAQFQGSKASSGLFQGFMDDHVCYGSLQWRPGIVWWLRLLVADLGGSGSVPWVGDSPSLIYSICVHWRWGHGLSRPGWGLWRCLLRRRWSWGAGGAFRHHFLRAAAQLLVARVGLVYLGGRWVFEWLGNSCGNTYIRYL